MCIRGYIQIFITIAIGSSAAHYPNNSAQQKIAVAVRTNKRHPGFEPSGQAIIYLSEYGADPDQLMVIVSFDCAQHFTLHTSFSMNGAFMGTF